METHLANITDGPI